MANPKYQYAPLIFYRFRLAGQCLSLQQRSLKSVKDERFLSDV